MRLLKEYEEYVQWSGWRIEEPAPGHKQLLGWAMVAFHIPGDERSTRGYYWQVRLPFDADREFKEAGKAYAYRQLCKNFDLALTAEHKPMRTIAEMTPYSPLLQRLINNFK